MCYPLPKWVMGNGFWWMGGLPITLPIQVWLMGNTLTITHFGLSRLGKWMGKVDGQMTCSTEGSSVSHHYPLLPMSQCFLGQTG